MVAANTVIIHAQVDAQRATEVASSHALSVPSAHGDLTRCLTNCPALKDLRRTSPHCTNRSRHVRKETLDQLIQIIGRPHSSSMCELMWPSLDKYVARVADSGTLRPWDNPSVKGSPSNSPSWGRLNHNTGQSCWRDLDG